MHSKINYPPLITLPIYCVKRGTLSSLNTPRLNVIDRGKLLETGGRRLKKFVQSPPQKNNARGQWRSRDFLMKREAKKKILFFSFFFFYLLIHNLKIDWLAHTFL